MLNAIENIQNIGIFKDFKGQRQRFKKINLIYGENGRGKSTLTSLFRSYHMNNSQLILERKTADQTDDPYACLLFNSGLRKEFKNGQWNTKHRDFLIFDLDFVEKNVYAGSEVSAEQRKNFLQFALGASAVAAQKKYIKASEAVKHLKASIKTKKEHLEFASEGTGLKRFRDLKQDLKVGEKLKAIDERISDARKSEKIQRKPEPRLLSSVAPNVEDILSTLTKSLESIHANAEALVKNHMENTSLHMQPWLEKGASAYLQGNTCPFCAQDIASVDLVQAYRSYFDDQYKELQEKVSQAAKTLNRVLNPKHFDNCLTAYQTALESIESWRTEHGVRYEAVIPLAPDDCRSQWSLVMEMFTKLIAEKQENVLEACDTSAVEQEIRSLNERLTTRIDEINDFILKYQEKIQAYKSELLSENEQTLEDQRKLLLLTQKRYSEPILKEFEALEDLKTKLKQEEATKKQTKEELESIMDSNLKDYREEVNQILCRLGANFNIPGINYSYQGTGEPRSDFGLNVRGKNVQFGKNSTDFKHALSEADKRTLAFAFFVTCLKQDATISEKIVVVDDPMCSLDINRKQQTCDILREIEKMCKQLIIVAHDAQFLKTFRDELINRQNVLEQDIFCMQIKSGRGDYSIPAELDLDRLCESPYFRYHRILAEYLDGEDHSPTEIVTSIRPMLEGYLHLRFPTLLPQRQLFGNIVKQIQNASPTDPLHYGKLMVNELNAINTYAGPFHHETNPTQSYLPVETELKHYVGRALSLVYHGGLAVV